MIAIGIGGIEELIKNVGTLVNEKVVDGMYFDVVVGGTKKGGQTGDENITVPFHPMGGPVLKDVALYGGKVCRILKPLLFIQLEEAVVAEKPKPDRRCIPPDKFQPPAGKVART